MRLFIAIEISAVVRAALAAMLKEFRAIAPQVKWVRPENMHITLKFLGETDSSKLKAVQAALSAIRSSEAATFHFRGLGFFPNEKRAKVFWAGMEASPNLPALAAEIDRAMHKIGFPLEDRPFTPHLTLARLQPPGLSLKLAAVAQESASRDLGSLTTREFHLIESRLKPGGAEYTTLQSFPFVAEV
ncbi:MAG TPA: RNA 2',3'-cyclic phosphodiesterase [Verrucomicrobiae bacterium]|nr:RNA 2',3'-cyclic phosphodiesterase [Verrucomicrobiae bacterium]